VIMSTYTRAVSMFFAEPLATSAVVSEDMTPLCDTESETKTTELVLRMLCTLFNMVVPEY